MNAQALIERNWWRWPVLFMLLTRCPGCAGRLADDSNAFQVGYRCPRCRLSLAQSWDGCWHAVGEGR